MSFSFSLRYVTIPWHTGGGPLYAAKQHISVKEMRGGPTMKIPVLTERDFEAMRKDWNVFIKKIETTPLLITNEQWREILAANITSRTTHLERVTQLINIRPYIGITDVGLVAIYTGNDMAKIKDATGVTWVTKTTLGTYENADDPKIEGVTVSQLGTTNTLGKIELVTFRDFFSIFTDDLRDVPELSFEHTWLATEAFYLYTCGTATVTPIPDGAKYLRDFHFVRGNHTNAVEAYDESGRPYSGVLKLTGTNTRPQIEVLYEAITNPGTPRDRTVL